MTQRAPSGQTTAERARPVSALAIVLIYATFAALWILFSDLAVEAVFREPTAIAVVSTLKGWLFVAVTSLLLYGLMRRQSSASGARAPRRLRWPGLAFLLLAIVIVAFAGFAIVHSLMHDREKETAQLQAIAELKAREIGDWLKERQGDTDFVGSSPFFPDLYRRWREAGDAASGKLLQARLERFVQHRGGAAVTLLDPRGERLFGTGAAPQVVSPLLRAAALEAATTRRSLRVGPYRGMAGHVRLDFVAPLLGVAGSPPVIVLHFDPADWLFPALKIWPVPSASGETLLFRRDGDEILFLNELRHRKNAAAALRLPLARRELLAAQVLHGTARAGELLNGRDYRDVPAAGVARAIPGTDWFLIAKMDQSEMAEAAVWDSGMIALAGVLALFMAGAGAYLLRQRHDLAIAAHVQQSQLQRLRDIAEREKAAEALRASEERYRLVLEHAADAVFIADPAGRYVYANQQAVQLLGYGVEELLAMSIADVTAPDEMELALGCFAQLKEKGCMRLELKLKRRDGGSVPVELNGVLLPDGNLYVSYRDVSARRVADADLRSRNAELERFNRATVGRELDMIELKRQINALSRQLGREPPYPLVFLASPAQATTQAQP